MKNLNKTITVLLLLMVFSSCTRVELNYYGVLMENYGKNGKSDYSIVVGKVNTMSPGTELFQIPAFEQRGKFTTEGDKETTLKLKASDNTEFTAKPLYSYKIIKERCIDVVCENSRFREDDNFMEALEDKLLEPHIYDIIKEESRKYTTDTLMATGGSLKFEKRVEDRVRKLFEEKGLKLLAFSTNLDFSAKVKTTIDKRNEVNTNISVLDQQILEQNKRIELAILKAQENIELSKGLTPQILQQQFIEKWDGKTALYGNLPISVMKKE